MDNTITLASFLSQEITKDEEVARAAAGWDRSGRERVPGVWTRSGMNSVESVRGSVVYGDGPAPDDAEAEHIALNDPARVLAECAAKRAILAMHPMCGSVAGESCRELRILAAVYADRPDYNEEWR